MADLNSYSFSGRLAAEPEIKYTQGGTAIWSGRVAVSYGYGDNKGTSWITIKALGKRAEAFGKWSLEKGQQVWGSGELQVREYDKNDGSKRVAVDVLIEQFGSASAGGNEQRGGSSGSRGGAPQRQRQQSTKPAPVDDLDSEDIPFATNRSVW